MLRATCLTGLAVSRAGAAGAVPGRAAHAESLPRLIAAEGLCFVLGPRFGTSATSTLLVTFARTVAAAGSPTRLPWRR
jgi:hypothetical protein